MKVEVKNQPKVSKDTKVPTWSSEVLLIQCRVTSEFHPEKCIHALILCIFHLFVTFRFKSRLMFLSKFKGNVLSHVGTLFLLRTTRGRESGKQPQTAAAERISEPGRPVFVLAAASLAPGEMFD